MTTNLMSNIKVKIILDCYNKNVTTICLLIIDLYLLVYIKCMYIIKLYTKIINIFYGFHSFWNFNKQ